MKKLLLLLGMFILPLTVFAGASRTLDGQFITNGAFTLTLPGITDTMVTRTSTDTLSNKSLSGSSNTFTNIPASAVSSGQLSVGNGGTGASSFTLNGILFGNTTSALQVTAAGSQFQSLQAGSGGVPAFDALHLNQAAAVTGTLPIGNGGTGQATASGAINALLPSQTSQSGNFLTTNGTVASWASIPAANQSLHGSSASPQSVTAAGGVSVSSQTSWNVAYVVGSPGAVTVTATPSISACTVDGQELKVIGTDNTKTVTLQDQANLASSGLSLNGNWIGAKDSALTLHCDITQGLWVEDSRR